MFDKQQVDRFEKIQGEKYLWKFQKVDEEKVQSIASSHSLSYPVAQTLCSRGFVTSGQINEFLFSSFEKDVHDSLLLKDAQAAVDRIIKAIEKEEKILIFGDYDVDGITSTSLLLTALLPLGANINYYLPNRRKEGYGLSSTVVNKAAAHNYSLIITVDNGVTAIIAAEKAKELGVDLIITDHHRPHDSLPLAVALVDPSQDDCGYPYKFLAGVGVIFKLVSLLYKNKKLKLPDKVYELLMLGTVADVVPLTGENRFWVRHGLCKVNAQRSLAMSSLAENSNFLKKRWTSLDIGFGIAPQINALGRLDDPREAVKFLISSNYDDVRRIAKVLKKTNEERKDVERKIFEEIEGSIVNKEINLDKENVIVAASQDWAPGVIGLVAGRLMQNYGKPTFLFHANKDGTLAGSCRSIPEFDIFQALSENKDLLITFGGHAFAAGLKLKTENMGRFKEKLEAKIAAELPAEVLQPKLTLDAFCELPDMTNKLLHDLEQLEPFGNSNMQPMFFIKDLTLIKPPVLLKDKHVKCSVFSQGIIKPVIFFNRPDLYSFFNNIGDRTFHIAGYVTKNEWNDRVNIELQGLDVAV